MSSIKKYVAEFIGTAVLVIFGCGTAMTVGCDAASGCGYLLTALAFGLVIVAMAYSIGNISGCHVNPAVSMGMLIAGKMSGKDFVGYVIAQFLGATAGAMFLKVLFDMTPVVDQTGAYGANALAGGHIGMSFVLEAVLTFVFVFTILGVTSKKENDSTAGLVIGLTLTLVHILGIGFTGTSVNPARSFGPALIAGGSALAELPVFIAAPLVGGALAAVVFRLFEGKKQA